jgi:hypothetical protein
LRLATIRTADGTRAARNSTGTPAGVGHGRVPPVYLRPGQVVRTEIEGIGALVNPSVSDPTN